jgi:DnaD/phage-associated family protein
MLLINHCAERLKKRYGEGRLPTMHAVEKEAFRWVNREIVTIQQAESYIAEADRREQEEAKALRMMGIVGRSPTSTERKYLDSWLAMGFSADVLALAYDRTVVNTNKLSWAYMNKILTSWQEQGLFAPEDIEKGDVRPGGKRWGKQDRRRDDASDGDDAARLARMLNVKE